MTLPDAGDASPAAPARRWKKVAKWVGLWLVHEGIRLIYDELKQQLDNN
jgi:hypothetical protein